MKCLEVEIGQAQTVESIINEITGRDIEVKIGYVEVEKEEGLINPKLEEGTNIYANLLDGAVQKDRETAKGHRDIYSNMDLDGVRDSYINDKKTSNLDVRTIERFVRVNESETSKHDGDSIYNFNLLSGEATIASKNSLKADNEKMSMGVISNKNVFSVSKEEYQISLDNGNLVAEEGGVITDNTKRIKNSKETLLIDTRTNTNKPLELEQDITSFALNGLDNTVLEKHQKSGDEFKTELKNSNSFDKLDGNLLKENIVKSFNYFARGEKKEVTMRLEPEWAGKLIVKVLEEKEGLSAKIIADNPSTKEWLDSQTIVLKDMLREAGHNITRFTIERGNMDFGAGLDLTQQRDDRRQKKFFDYIKEKKNNNAFNVEALKKTYINNARLTNIDYYV